MSDASVERGPHRRALDRSLERPLIVFVSLLAVTVTGLVVGQADASNPLVWWGLPPFWIATALLWRATRGHGVGNVEVSVITLATVSLSYAYMSQSVVQLPPGVRDAPLAAVVFLVTAFATPRLRILLLVTAIGAVLPFEIDQNGVLAAIEFIGPVVASIFAVYGAVRYLRDFADRADSAAEVLRERSTRAAVAAERRRSQRDINGIIHDHVISALRAVRLTTPEWREVRDAADNALSNLTRGSAVVVADNADRVLLAPMLGEVAGRTKAEFIDHGANARASSDVTNAVVAATGELVRNAWRHARPSHVVIELKESLEGWEVVVSDDGSGFDAVDTERYGHGLRHSVTGGLESVGATVSVESTAGAGTVATLTWSAATTEVTAGRDPEHRRDEFTANMGDLAGTVSWMVYPYFVTSTLSAIHNQFLGQPAWLLVWWGLGVVLAYLAISRLNQGVPPWLSLASIVTAFAGSLAFGSLVWDASMTNFSTWPLGGLSGLLIILYFGRPRSWESATALLGLQVLVWIPAYLGYWDGASGIEGVLNAMPASLSTAVPFIIVVVLAREINRLRKFASKATDEAETVAHLTAQGLAREAAFARRLDHVREQVAPFLSLIAASTHREPAWQDTATRLEQLARDELHIPGVLDSEAREALLAARQAGCVVSFHVPDADIQNSRAARDLIKAALASGTPPREFTLAVSHHEHTGHEQFSAVTIPGDPLRAAGFTHRFSEIIVNFDDSPEATWVEVVPGSSSREDERAA